MKTRNSISGKDDPGKEVLSSLLDNAISSNIDSPSIVRKLRSRVITSDTEDDCHVRTRTPKSNRKATRENSKSQQDNDEVAGASLRVENDAGLKTKTPKRNKRLSTVNLFQIVEVKEEENAEEKVEEEGTENEGSEATSNYNLGTGSIYSHGNLPHEDNAIPSSGVVNTEVSLPEESEESEESSDVASLTSAQNEEATEKEEREEEEIIQTNFMEDKPMDREFGRDSGSDDDAPEAVSFSSSKNTINTELTLIAEAIKKEKAKRKDCVRKKIEMIRIQKAEKEERRKQKMKFLEVNVPERLAEDVTSSLPDKPDIPTVKKSVSINKKRKNEEKVKFEPRIEEKKNKILKFDDYIPITNVVGSTQFGVVPLEVTARLPKSSSQSAAEFKQKALFGSRIRREPSKNLLIYRQKLSAAGRLQKSLTSSSLLKI